jgi:hypothetical protein
MSALMMETLDTSEKSVNFYQTTRRNNPEDLLQNLFCQLLNVHGVSDITRTEIHTAELLVPKPRSFEFEIAIENFKIYKSPVTDHIRAKLIPKIYRLINCIWNKEELPEQWKLSIIVPTCKKGNKTDSTKYRGISLL